MKRTFTKYPSSYVKANEGDDILWGSMDERWNETHNRNSSAYYLNYDYDLYNTYEDYDDAKSASNMLKNQGYETQINHHVVRDGVENYEVLYWMR